MCSFKNRDNDLNALLKHVIIADGIVNGIYSAPYILLYVMRRGHILSCLMFKI